MTSQSEGPSSGLADTLQLWHSLQSTAETPFSSSSSSRSNNNNNSSSGIISNISSSISSDNSMLDGCIVSDREFLFLPWDNPDNILTQESMHMIYKVCGLVVFPLAILGVILNVLNGAVYAKLGLKDRINLLLFSLAGADLVACVYFSLHSYTSAMAIFFGGTPVTGPLIVALTESGALIMFGSTYVSGFISTSIACERCLCILKPFKAKTLIKTSTTAVVLLSGSALIMGLHYFISEKYTIRCLYVPALGRFHSGVVPSQFYLDHSAFVDVLNVIVFGVALPAFFVLITAVATVTTAVQLKKAAAWRQTSTSASTTTSTTTTTTSSNSTTAETALTRMLVAVSCLFVVCTVPNIVIRTAPIFVGELRMGGRQQNMLMTGAAVVHAVGAVNSSLNFFVYYRMGSRFRDTLRLLVCRGVRPGGGGGCHGKAVWASSEGATSVVVLALTTG